MKPPAWVNWEQFANLNEEETKRAEQNRQQARDEEQENFLNLTGQLQNEAMGQAGARQFGGLEKIGKFKDVMDARDAALKNQTPMMGAAWEQHLDPNKNAPYKSPWANLDQMLGQINQSAQRGQAAAVQREKDRIERNRLEEEKRKAAAIQKEEARKEGVKNAVEDIRIEKALEGLEQGIKVNKLSGGPQGKLGPIGTMVEGGEKQRRERIIAGLLQHYGLDRNDPRVRDLLRKYGLA